MNTVQTHISGVYGNVDTLDNQMASVNTNLNTLNTTSAFLAKNNNFTGINTFSNQCKPQKHTKKAKNAIE